jgi:LPS-assembly protein
VLYADEITYNSATGDSTVEGHVVLDGGPYDEHVEASHGNFNVRAQAGTFYDVIGSAGFRLRRTGYTLTTSNPFSFTGKVVEKQGPDHYLVRQGTVTTCELPSPKWRFEASRITVDVDGSAKIYNSTFQLGGIPVVYFPFVTHPVQKQQRQSGFLIPSFGNSSRKGKIIGESVYWALNRSMDITVGAEYYSTRGWSQRGEFRARPSDTSFIDFNYFGVLDRGIGNPVQNQGGEDAPLHREGRFDSFRSVASVVI